MTVLFLNGVANGVSPVVHESRGGAHVFSASGTFDGATISLQLKSKDDPNSEWVTQANAIFTQSSNKYVELIPANFEARAIIATVGASTNLFSEITT